MVDNALLKQLEPQSFRDGSFVMPAGEGFVYGGQLVAQALRVAALTIDDARLPHSLHAYFARPAQPSLPVVMTVDRDHDGRSFSKRRVTGTQQGAVVITASVSFHQTGREVSWSRLTPDIESPAGQEERAYYPMWDATLRMRPYAPAVPYEPGVIPAPSRLWVRSRDPLPPDPLIHLCALAYVSDLGSGFGDGNPVSVVRNGPTLEHSLWFHDVPRMDDWVLLDLSPVKVMGVRGLYDGAVYGPDAMLGAVLMQEVLLKG